MTDRELLQQALDTLRHLCLHSRAVQGYDGEQVQSGIDALKARLAEPEREWVGLTDGEKKVICQEAAIEDWTDLDVINTTESKLKEKNG